MNDNKDDNRIALWPKQSKSLQTFNVIVGLETREPVKKLLRLNEIIEINVE